jgi:hypothetical protein
LGCFGKYFWQKYRTTKNHQIMSKFLLTTILCTVLLGCLYGQPKQDRYRDQQWLTGYDGINLPKALGNLLDFRFSPPSIDSIGSAMAVEEANAQICDTNGQLLIYTNGVFVANGQHEIIEGGENIDPTGWAYLSNYTLGYHIVQGCLILPLPENESKYYIIHEGNSDSNGAYPIAVPDLRYSLVDMSANNGAGKVIEQKKLIINHRLDEGKISACRHANGRDWWVLVNKFLDNAYYRLLLDPQGLRLDGLQEIGTIADLGIGAAVFSPDGNWYARINSVKYAEPYYLDIFRFDRCSGLLYDPVQYVIDSGNIAGLAISQDSRYLYEMAGSKIWQYDLQASNIWDTRTKVAIYDGYGDPFPARFFQAQLAPDGRIFITTSNGTKVMHTIDHPERPGIACKVCQHCVDVPNYMSASAPNYPHFRLGPVDGSVCDSLGINSVPIAGWRHDTVGLIADFTSVAWGAPTEWKWTFGDLEGGSSTLENPYYVYQRSGFYNVCQIVSNQYGSDTLCRTIRVIKPYIPPIPDTTAEPIPTILLTPNPASVLLQLTCTQERCYGAVWEMFDLTGRQVRKGKIAAGGPLTQIDCNQLPRGMYMMRVRFAAGGQWVKKVVLE